MVFMRCKRAVANQPAAAKTSRALAPLFLLSPFLSGNFEVFGAGN
jgi:hypothetical protein